MSEPIVWLAALMPETSRMDVFEERFTFAPMGNEPEPVRVSVPPPMFVAPV